VLADKLMSLWCDRTRDIREDYNCPPYFRVVHYAEDDLEVPAQRNAITWARRSYTMTVTLLVLNLFSNFILAAGGVRKAGIHSVYSLFNLCIAGILGGYSVYHQYKGLVTGSSKMTSRGLLVQLAVLLFILLSCFLGFSNFNGWANLKRARRSSKMSGFWVVWTLIESCSWMANFGLSVVVFYLVYSSSDQPVKLLPDFV